MKIPICFHSINIEIYCIIFSVNVAMSHMYCKRVHWCKNDDFEGKEFLKLEDVAVGDDTKLVPPPSTHGQALVFHPSFFANFHIPLSLASAVYESFSSCLRTETIYARRVRVWTVSRSPQRPWCTHYRRRDT